MFRPDSDAPPAEAVREELDRILASGGFVRNERLSRFLRFVVERHLEGRDDGLKEWVVGIEVLGRKTNFDPRVDSTVRSEAARLRSRLVEYYAGDGRTDAVRITLPKGGYVPRCQWLHPTEPAAAAASPLTKKSVSALSPRVGITAVVLGLVGLGWWWGLRPSSPITIAVLPLENLSR